MSAVFEPRSCRTDVVSGTLLVDLNQDRGILNIPPIPLVEWGEELQTIAGEAKIAFS